jgi:hypothetical protein
MTSNVEAASLPLRRQRFRMHRLTQSGRDAASTLITDAAAPLLRTHPGFANSVEISG